MILWASVCGTMLGLYFLVRTGLAAVNASLTWIWDTLVIYQTLAARDLDRHARSIAAPLLLGDLEGARHSVSYIVGRDTQNLGINEISRATLEAVAESTTDGFVAPLFWAAVGGAPAALLYRSVNTLDSMVGHRNDRYELMGKFSAIADDAFNFIPARLCALASLLPRFFKNTAAVISEANKHVSPNAGWSEAAAAWALNVRLGGKNFYDGVAIEGPIFNATAPDPYPSDISRVLRWFWSIVLFCVLSGATALYLRDRHPKLHSSQPQAPEIQPASPNWAPILQRSFIQQQSTPPEKIHGQIKRPESHGKQTSP
jgi:adenosylcobinamide-phosphate synthase